MKIAVPYENGQVFQHFGKAAQFKIYEAIDDEIISQEVVDTHGSGHKAMLDLMKEKQINVLICGGVGVAAVGGLLDAGIQILGGAEGSADDQVADFLGGKLHFEAPGACAGCPASGGCSTAASGGCAAASSCGSHNDCSVEEECDGNISACLQHAVDHDD